MVGAGNVWAITEEDIIINVRPNSAAGSVEVTSISGMTVTISAVPATGYTIDASHILVEKMVSPSLSRRAPGLSSGLEVTSNGGNSYSFTIPEGYDGAYVTANFYKATANGITSLDQITDLSGTYVLTADVNAAGFSGKGEFTGTLDGGYHKIYNLSKPLFSSTSGSAVIRNITFEDISISETGDAGAVTGSAGGNTRIYNCGIIPSSVERDGEGNITGFYGSSVGSTNGGNCGGLVGTLSGTAHVINCYSYATITGGSNVGGIVGYNSVASSQDNVATMVMNCMFYGDITNGSTVSPVYGGENINNVKMVTVGEKQVNKGLATYNYYAYSRLKSTAISNNKYNCALAMEERFLNRCELYRQLLNSNKKLAAIYATGSAANANQMAKWVLETADRTILNPLPYPVLKEQGTYPSIINYDAVNAPDSASVGRLNGGRLGTKVLKVSIQGVGDNAPDGASLTKSSLSLIRTDKDTTRYNFNYDKVQLPYYNDVGTGNYTKNKVVTGWKIVSVSGGTAGTFTEGDAWGGYNFADRRCTNKDVYGESGRVFSQGAYYDVPYGVTGITIEPYWGQAAYVSDRYYDVVYTETAGKNNNYGSQEVSGFGTQNTNNTNITINGSSQKVYTSIDDARKSMSYPTNTTVYDKAVVLVGNVHQAGALPNATTPYSIMSVDLDKDNEPDYSFIFSHYNRQSISPIRFDFINVPGTAQAQKPNGATQLLNVSIFNPRGWFEVTNTCSMYITQFEADNGSKDAAPVIFLGGVIDQYTSTKETEIEKSNYNYKTQYIHLGSNVCFKEFGNGTHSDGFYATRHVPVSVTGGDFEGFYLSGVYRPDAQIMDDDAEGYVCGGRFKEMAGAAQQMINGNVQWQIYDADITNFYGGGINADKPITGSVTVDIINSRVGTYCGGPKFGDMQKGGTTFTTKYSKNKQGTSIGTKNIDIAEDGIVTTNAVGCTFGKFFGAGYGGDSSFKLKYFDNTSPNFSSLIGNYNDDRGKYYDGADATYKSSYGNKGPGVATDFDYEFFVWSTGAVGARFYVNYTSFSLAKTNNVNSTLTKCTINENFYGGGSLGVVDGTATSILDGCIVNGSVYGGGFSASIPTVPVRATGFKVTPQFNANSGIFEMGEKNGTTNFQWKEGTPVKNASALDGDKILTNVDLDNLGVVSNTNLTVRSNTEVKGSVYGGGEESGVDGNTIVTVTGSPTIGEEGQGGAEYGNVYGGGKGKEKDVAAGLVKGNTNVSISGSPTILHNVYGGGAYGSVGTFTYADDDYHTAHPEVPVGMPTACAESTGNTSVTITGGTFGTNGHENGMVFGSSRGDVATPEGTPAVDPNDRMAWVYSTQVNIGTENATTGPTIKGSIYGSGENGHTLQNTVLNINSGTVGIPTGEKITDDNGTPDNKDDDIEYSGANYPYRGNVYGGGCGTDTYNDGTVDKYNPLAGIVKGTTTIYIKGGHVVRNVYGAGAMGSVGGGTTTDAGKTTINVTGGRIGYDGNSNNDGCIFGAARGENGISTATSNLANVRETEVNINAHPTDATKSPVIWGSVFGGGEAGTVKEGVAVNMTGGLIHKDIYGGGALADTQTSNYATGGTWADAQKSALHTTTVRATGGRVVEEIFGGGLGEDGKPAYVWGDVLVDLNGTTSSGTTGTPIAVDAKGCVVGQIFGCNNINGTPKGDVMVHVYATQNAAATQIANTGEVTNAKVKGRYDVTAVYGGGNMAAYEPADPDNNKSEVIIDGCQLTSIKTVYGGGNAACTPSTNVTVNGTFEVEELFGGGNGLDDIDVNGVTKPNPGANVGYKNYSEYYQEGGVWKVRDKAGADTKEERLVSSYVYGTGKASVNIFGGTVHRVFGGSNTKGNVRQTAVTLLDENSGCDFCVDEAYGGGKSAPMDAEAKLLMSCIPGLKAAYGGAEAANIEGDVTLNITNGNFDRVFGGNNKSGRIGGTITVNIEETGCKPVIIGQLYGGGNQAPYTAPEGEHGPTLNIKSFTSIGEVYGGGYGEGAIVTGDTYVNINEVVGDKSSQDEFMKETVTDVTDPATQTTGTDKVSKNTGVTKTFKDGDGDDANTISVDIPLHKQGDIGSIGVVFGGGNAAQVVGNTHVNIGTLSSVDYVTKASGESVARTGITPVGADIRGNVYGGGNNAEVTGDTHVVIGEKYVAP